MPLAVQLYLISNIKYIFNLHFKNIGSCDTLIFKDKINIVMSFVPHLEK
jgi:hypothetical protein